jgi:hypothetical protein
MWWRRRKTNSFAEPLIDFWTELRENIHPRDYPVLNGRTHTLNTDYPPPAFVGDIRRARVFVLMANGGYDDERTTGEFALPGSAQAYRDRFKNPVPSATSYWKGTKLEPWLLEGQAAVVNAMAYRSCKISEEPENRAIAEKLPSVQFHREWLRSHLMPAIGEAGVMVIVHRPRLWKLNAPDNESDFFLFTKSPRYKHLPNWATNKAEAFLEKHDERSLP